MAIMQKKGQVEAKWKKKKKDNFEAMEGKTGQMICHEGQKCWQADPTWEPPAVTQTFIV